MHLHVGVDLRVLLVLLCRKTNRDIMRGLRTPSASLCSCMILPSPQSIPVRFVLPRPCLSHTACILIPCVIYGTAASCNNETVSWIHMSVIYYYCLSDYLCYNNNNILSLVTSYNPLFTYM